MKSWKFIFIILFLSCLITSCVPQKRIKYLQQAESSENTNTFLNERGTTYLIQSGDNLYIKVMSLDEKTSNVFNAVSSANAYQTYTSDASIYLSSYTVNEFGYIEFPLAGQVLVKNLTVEQVKENIQGILDEYLKETVLIVKLVNFNITVLGEVRKPGQYKIYQSEINIFEAISMAGDLTDFSKRNNVKIIRQTKTGSEVITLDLEQASILSSNYYYMRPNDIIYVEPLKIKQFGFTEFPYATIFSGISTVLLLINYFK